MFAHYVGMDPWVDSPQSKPKDLSKVERINCSSPGAVAQTVRAPVCRTGSRGFDSRQPRSLQSILSFAGANPAPISDSNQ